MGDFVALVRCIKKICKETIEAEKPSGVYYGRVTSVSPLRIQVEQGLVLDRSQLVLTRNVTNHSVDMTVNHVTNLETEHTHEVQDTYTGGGTSSPTSHLHGYTGRKRFLIHNGLVIGDRVILMRMQGGQRYVVIDRIG